MKFIRASAFLAATFFATAAFAQPVGVQQLQNSQAQQLQMPQPELRTATNAPELYVGENEDIGPQRILRANSKKTSLGRQWFDITLDSQAFYSDNANFANDANKIGSFVFVNTAQAAFAPTPFDLGPGKFAPAAGFVSQWYNYSSGQMKPLDFDAQTAFVNLRYLLGNWQFSAGGNYTRLLGQDSYEETYREWLPSVSAQRAFAISDRLALLVGDVVDYHFSHVPSVFGSLDDVNDHLDEMIFLTLNWQVSAHLAVQPFYRFQYSFYNSDAAPTGADRNDILNSAGLTMIYSFNQYASLRAFFSYNTKWSDDQNTSHYDELNGGLGAALDVRF